MKVLSLIQVLLHNFKDLKYLTICHKQLILRSYCILKCNIGDFNAKLEQLLGSVVLLKSGFQHSISLIKTLILYACQPMCTLKLSNDCSWAFSIWRSLYIVSLEKLNLKL